MQKTRIHPETGDVLRRDIRSMVVSYEGLSETVRVPGWYPDGDGDSIHTGADLDEQEAVFQGLKRRASTRRSK